MNNNPRGSTPPFGTLLKGYLAFTGSYFVITFTSILLIIGLFFYFDTIGLYVSVPYFVYTLTLGRHYELHDGAKNDWFSKHFIAFPAMRKFLQLNFYNVPIEITQAQAEPNAQFILAAFPHGVWSDYHVCMDGTWHLIFPNIYQNIRTLTASPLFRIPIVREYALLTSGIDARKSTAERALKQYKRTILVRPGGEAEQLRTTRGVEKVYLKNRKGFIKLAMEQQVPVIPIYIFGPSDYHYTWNYCFGIRQWIQKKFRICLPLAWGYYGSMCPFPIRTSVVLAKPMTFQMKDPGNPTIEEINVAHEQFCTALIDLFNQHKINLGYGDRELQLV